MPIPAGAGGSADVVTLTDVRTHLNYPNPTQASNDDNELQGFIAAADDVIRAEVGDVLSTIYTEVHSGGGPTIVLNHPPVIAVTSVTEFVGPTGYALTDAELGSTTGAYAFSLDDPEAGIICRRYSGGLAGNFAGGYRNITVTYTAGRASVPPSVRLAALELIAHWWQGSQQTPLATPGGGTIGSSGYDTLDTQAGYQAGVPYRVLELLKPYRSLPGIA